MKAAVRASAGKARWRGRDAHERQAEAGAAGFIRGERQLGHGLTAAPVAGYRVPGSFATFLPRPLTGELESAFGVDLGGLRIHRDAPANDAARSLGARAFTSGSAIFFAERAWDPGSVRGRRLIAHEVAHAIQQTARATQGGLRLEPDAVGQAGVQRDPDVNEVVHAAHDRFTGNDDTDALFRKLDLLAPKTGIAACLKVLDRHLAPPEDAAVTEQVAKLRKALTGKADKNAADIIETVLAEIPAEERTDRLIALFYDCFKAADAGRRALRLAGGKIPQRTAFGSWEFFEKHRRGDGRWAVQVLRINEAVARYVFGTFVAFSRLDFYGLARGVLDLDPDGKFIANLRDAIEHALTYDPLMADERMVAALRALVRFDRVRQAPLVNQAKKIGNDQNAIRRAELKLGLISSYLDTKYLANIVRLNGMEKEVEAIAEAAGAALEPVARRAAKFWTDSSEIYLAILGGKQDDQAAQEKAGRLREILARYLPTVKSLTGIRKRLVGALEIATRPQGGGLPGVAGMTANRKAAAALLKNLTYELDGLIAESEAARAKDSAATKDGSTVKPPPENVVIEQTALGVLLLILLGMHDRLIAEETVSSLELDELGLKDQAAVIYRQTVRRFRFVGDTAGFIELVSAADEAEFSAKANWTQSHIALLGRFELQPSSLGQFIADFPGGETIGLPLGGGGLKTAVAALYQETLLGTLQATLNEQIGAVTREHFYQFDKTHGPIINDAIKRANDAMAMPRRFRVPEEKTIILLAQRESDDIAGVLKREKHSEFIALQQREMGDNDAWFAPQNLGSHRSGLVVWVVPRIDRLANRLAGLPFIAGLEIAKGRKLGPPDRYPGGPYKWLEALGTIVGNRKGLREQIEEALRQWNKEAQDALAMPYRRATNNLRRTVGPMIEKLWQRLTVSVFDDGHYSVPRDALDLSFRFVAGIRPVDPGEQELQKTALMLELAPVLDRKLRHTDRLDIILPFYKPIANAAAVARDPVKANTIRTFDLGFDPDDIATRAQTLQSLAEAFQKTTAEQRSERKLGGNPIEKTLFVPGRPYPLTARQNEDDDADDIVKNVNKLSSDGKPIFYQLLNVYQAFIFSPEVGEGVGQAKLDIRGVAAGAVHVALCELMITEGSTTYKRTVYSEDTDLLSALFYALDFKITNEALQTLGDVLEVVADILITAIQILFPEFAPEIAYAQLASSIVQFFGGAEYQTIKSLLSGDLGDAFSKGIDKLKEELSPDLFWDYLLFQDLTLPPALAALDTVLHGFVNLGGGMSTVGRPKHEKTGGAIKKVVEGIASFATALLDGVKSVHEHVGPPVRKVELFVEGEPYLAALLRFVARNIGQLDHMSLDDVGDIAAGKLVGTINGMFEHAEHFIDELANFELPPELVPVETILEMVVNLIIDRLPPKYRVALRGVENIKAVNDILQWIYGKAANALREHKIDPNILWRTVAKDALDPVIHDVGTAIAGSLRELLVDVPFIRNLGASLKEVTVKPHTASFAGDPQPMMAGGRTPPDGPACLPMGEGEELPPEDRARAQRGMGHDFRHVRIHRGSSVDAALRGAGAEAATAGSHVYLDSSVNTVAMAGRDTLNHELAHVLQQGGARPLGETHPDRPTSPTSGGSGWRVDRGAEAQADRLANAAREPAAAPREVTPQHGVQPKLLGLVGRFFAKLADADELHGTAEKLGGTKVVKATLKKAAPGLETTLGPALVKAFGTRDKPGPKVTASDKFEPALADLVKYVVDNRNEAITEGMPGVIMSAITDVTKKGGKKSGGKVSILNTTWLETRIEEFLFGMTGLSVDVELHFTSAQEGPDGRMRKMVVANDPIASLNIRYAHFPFIGAGSDAWTNLIRNSYPTLKDAERSEKATKARLVLKRLQAGPGLFDTVKRKGKTLLVFSAKTIEDIEQLSIRVPKGTELPGDFAPKWNDYLKTDFGPPAGQYNQIGLRIGLHNQLNSIQKHGGTERESHHTVQFLLLEYFNNAKPNAIPFPVKDDLYPGVKRNKKGEVETIRPKPTGADEIRIHENFTERGGPMPALLLSAFAHGADVHITPKPDDDAKDPPSQGVRVHRIFHDALGKYGTVVESAEQLAALQGNGTAKAKSKLPANATKEELAQTIFDAAVLTYREVRDEMNPKLGVVLDREEKDYYNALVARASNPAIFKDKPQPGYNATGSVKTAIMPVVKDQQKAVLEGGFGFKAGKK